jgi:TetR/AcrR family transcriptional repressor of nem operon
LTLSEAVRGLFEMKFSNINNPLMSQGCLLTNSILELKSNNPTLHDHVIDRYEQIYTAMASFFEWFVKNNKVVKGIDAQHLTDVFLTFQQGLNVQSRNQQAKESMARAIDLFLTLLKTLEEK